ncbi:Glycogen debranching enzyme (alpha-1,6-glucosidase) [Streptomyces sp. 2112.3]|nr:glycogen debranching enzyme [Streptomyces sp. 2321.6]SDR13685.1 Glycogen debranching enzyme (alpha-1,6-glucosidase) [Streptomyces sp. KS_16]SED69791.1 Glycogen debranching enzyme (alpha-1,6-glucosidase) [Streptomyces sp. 2133.1]SEE12269.1 Glycogen debranching enzyme (alpha-1,6-glucosidase) [Streptomyces sp. 2112.3]SNC71916.1 Glycogen debranching enzyme (alpha-1,6-glucosidase) [Streptomyces sp. 2114.4]
MPGIVPATRPAHRLPGARRPPSPRAPQPQPVHSSLVCVALPTLAVSPASGQLTGRGMDGFYRDGRRVLSRCELRVAGDEPLVVQGRLTSAGRARFIGTIRGAGERGPDPEIRVERLRSADGTEQITFRSSATRPVRLAVEIRLGTDLAELGAIAVGLPGPELQATVHGAGLCWSATGVHAVASATPSPEDALASAGLLRWALELPPGGHRSIELRTSLEYEPGGPLDHHGRAADARIPAPRTGTVARRTRNDRPPRPWTAARLECDDRRADALMASSLDDLHGLVMRDSVAAADRYVAGGFPWRCGLAPAEALWTARMLLPLGTRLAAGTLRALARSQQVAPGADFGRIPGALRDTGPHSPPSCTGIEATLLFPAVLAEACRWGLPPHEMERLLPAAEHCLTWLRRITDPPGGGRSGYVPDPGPGGPYRCETQAHAHRAALLGADLLDASRPSDAVALRDWAAGLRTRFRRDFWLEDPAGGRPAALLTADGRPVPHFGSTTAHLLDTGLLDGGTSAHGLLDASQTDQLAGLLAGPAMDSGWGLRGLSTKESGYNPFGHRTGAVRVHETAVAAAGLAAAGHEQAAGSLIKGVLDAAESFGYRLPEMYAGEQRTAGGVPVPHPAACRPAAVAAGGAVHILVTLAGLRPDIPAQTVSVRPLGTAPLGAMQLTGLCVAEQPFGMRISRLGMGMVETAAEGLQLVS